MEIRRKNTSNMRKIDTKIDAIRKMNKTNKKNSVNVFIYKTLICEYNVR